MKKLYTILLAMALPLTLAAQTDTLRIKLWPDGAPDSNGLSGPETTERGGGRIGNISDPEMLVFPAAEPNGQAVIICPGGYYEYVSSHNEGTNMAEWFNSMGITFAVLKYRMPNGHCDIPLEDAQRAITIMREHAGEYGFTKLGIMGGSAGGHLASSASVHFTPETRPDFQILIYPLITFVNRTAQGRKNILFDQHPTEEQIEFHCNEKNVKTDTPPCFIAHSQDDPLVPLRDSQLYQTALQEKGIPVELHVYPEGGHGWGFKKEFKYHEQFKADLASWLKTLEK